MYPFTDFFSSNQTALKLFAIIQIIIFPVDVDAFRKLHRMICSMSAGRKYLNVEAEWKKIDSHQCFAIFQFGLFLL